MLDAGCWVGDVGEGESWGDGERVVLINIAMVCRIRSSAQVAQVGPHGTAAYGAGTGAKVDGGVVSVRLPDQCANVPACLTTGACGGGRGEGVGWLRSTSHGARCIPWVQW